MSTQVPASGKDEPVSQNPVTETIPQMTEDDHDLLSSPVGPTTVFHDPENFNLKHPLINKWTLWYTKPPSQKGGVGENWAELLKEVITFDSVEEFWGVYNNIAKTSELAHKSDYHLFKAGVRPEWEDPQNKNGGKWSYQFKSQRLQVDELWLHAMLGAIGETLERENDDEVMGVVVNVRRGFCRIGLWTRTCDRKDALLKIGEKFRELLKLPEQEKLEFSVHANAAHSGSSRAKAKYTV
ncbi:Eukaryotic translation initiation factor 4E-1 [Neolecta irregularis DAH-3]|uniref:Eukaryotic translation initiation factor 4E-1 n=1 Tax=Neolecta irregularis (strain DAH-3) TaxID=1198029 RepID=A0A1U7LPZ8_NEOID|nr:Eukaryotic translation initiation factor 4E-1 [Neolecta irregularis DAH-3]|eukprot:OLL24746.1 Eukaryotic translation initiation factor 4E-1 [Neolecta irregularis DAH-3]